VKNCANLVYIELKKSLNLRQVTYTIIGFKALILEKLHSNFYFILVSRYMIQIKVLLKKRLLLSEWKIITQFFSRAEDFESWRKGPSKSGEKCSRRKVHMYDVCEKMIRNVMAAIKNSYKPLCKHESDNLWCWGKLLISIKRAMNSSRIELLWRSIIGYH
jgi:hypothetical protein